MTQAEVISRAKQHHGDKYDYSSIIYINQYNKIAVICPEHGTFEKWPKDFINGSGCPTCGSLSAKAKRTTTTQQFIEKSIEAHGNIYDYSNVNYFNNHTKVEIICQTHGSFWQEPWVHTSGHKCPYCSGNKIKPISDLVSSMRKTHGTTYDYSKVQVVGTIHLLLLHAQNMVILTKGYMTIYADMVVLNVQYLDFLGTSLVHCIIYQLITVKRIKSELPIDQ